MKVALAAILCIAAGTAFADDVTFTCELQGHSSVGADGFQINAVNTSGRVRTCSVTCNVTLGSGSTKDFPYRDQSINSSSSTQYVAGESAVSGAPLSNPKITSGSCN
jgi:hypothetical protein